MRIANTEHKQEIKTEKCEHGLINIARIITKARNKTKNQWDKAWISLIYLNG